MNAGRDFRKLDPPISSALFRKRWPDAVKALITGRYRMEDYRDLLLGRAGGIKNVIKLS